MKQVQNLQKLKTLSYFDSNTISQVTGVTEHNLNKNVSRWIKQGLLVQLKRGYYTTSIYNNSIQNKNSYLEFISNKLKYPSYLSLEYVLAKNQVLTESIYTFTSISTKKTRIYQNKLGNFSYRNISNKLFTGFNFINKDGFDITIASKAKALFDYLYLKFYREEIITNQMIIDLRLNLDEFTKKEVNEFKKYCNLTQIQKYIKLTQKVFPKYAN